MGEELLEPFTQSERASVQAGALSRSVDGYNDVRGEIQRV
jgi:hypothetical protein